MTKSNQRPVRLVTLSFVIAVCIIAAHHTSAIAETPAATTSAPPAQNTTPPDPSYTYNQTTGRWENGTYAWDPATGQTTPLHDQSYSYNPATGMWDTKDWQYNDTNKKYEESKPAPAPTPAPTSDKASSDAKTSNHSKQTDSTASKDTPGSKPGDDKSTDTTSGTKDSKKDGVQADDKKDGFFAGFYDARISTTVGSSAHTGDVAVTGNTAGGDATSGNAVAIANLINLLQSFWSADGTKPTTFTSDVRGDVLGDIFIDPRALGNQSSSGSGDPADVKVHAQTTGQLDNNVQVGATSGDANVARNTVGGNATSGDAHAVANILNLINSSIAAKQSFLGILNIYGNLNGDILFPAGFLEKLLASNGAPSTSASGGSGSANYSDTQNITNNLNTSATSGNASVSQNAAAGNATTGNALTKVTLLNLTGRQVIGNDSILVFVNVLGKWVGMIMDAPAGSTAAAVGGGISQNDSTPSSAPKLGGDVALSSDNRIHNNVQVASASGDANVARNTVGGNATSGDATASANILNLVNSNLGLSDWFGVLFINVFGSWTGSFGVNTVAGTTPTPAAPTPAAAPAPQPNQVFGFRGTQQSTTTPGTAEDGARWDYQGAGSRPSTTGGTQDVLSTYTTTETVPGAAASVWKPSLQNRKRNMTMPFIGAAIGAAMLGGEQAYGLTKRRKGKQSQASE